MITSQDCGGRAGGRGLECTKGHGRTESRALEVRALKERAHDASRYTCMPGSDSDGWGSLLGGRGGGFRCVDAFVLGGSGLC